MQRPEFKTVAGSVEVTVCVSEGIAEWVRERTEACDWDSVNSALRIGIEALERGKWLARDTVITEPQDIAVVKGQKGENQVVEILERRFGTVVNTTKSAKSGDISLLIDNYKIIIEVKNYKGKVPRSEVEKFYRDLIATNTLGGVFVSLASEITGVDEEFKIVTEYVEGRYVPVVYLASSDPELMCMAVNTVTQIAKILAGVRHDMLSHDSVVQLANAVGENLDTLTKSRIDMYGVLSDIVKGVSRHQSVIQSVENSVRGKLDELREITPLSVVFGGGDLDRAVNSLTYLTPVKESVVKLIGAMSRDSHVWKIAPKRLTHARGVINLKMRPEFVRNSLTISHELMLRALTTHPKKITISETFAIEISPETVDFIIEHLV